MLFSVLFSVVAWAFPRNGLEVESSPWNYSYEHTTNFDGMVIGSENVFPHMVKRWTGGYRNRQGWIGFIYRGDVFVIRSGSDLMILAATQDDQGLMITYTVRNKCSLPYGEAQVRQVLIFPSGKFLVDPPRKCSVERIARRL